MRQLIAILQCGNADDPEDDGSPGTTKTNTDAVAAKRKGKLGRKDTTQPQNETKRGVHRRRSSTKKKKKMKKPSPNDGSSKQASQVVLPLSGTVSGWNVGYAMMS